MFIDIFFVVLMVLAIFRGLRRGLIVAVSSLVGIIIGLAAAIKLSALVAAGLGDSFHLPARWLPVLAFILVFVLVLLAVRWIAKIIETAVDLAWLGWINKLGGLIFYVAMYSAVFSIFLFYGSQMHILTNHVMDSSIAYGLLAPWGPAVINGLGMIIPIFKDMFTQLKEFFAHYS